MYSIVMVMALSGGAEVSAWQDVPGRVSATADHGHRLNRRGRGCDGCCGGCYGCYGGCCGCYGGCYGGWGGCHGGYVIVGCWGGRAYGGYYGGYYGAMPAYGGYYGDFYGGTPYYGMPVPSGGNQDRQPADQNRDRRRDQGQPPEQIQAPATIVVNVPADARLTIDDHPTRSTSSVRTFVTPALQPGKTFHYTLKAEIERNGETLRATKDIEVRAGQETRVTFDFPGASVTRR